MKHLQLTVVRVRLHPNGLSLAASRPGGLSYGDIACIETGRLGIERRYQIASAAPIAEFAEIDALPHSQIQAMVGNWNGHGESDKRRFNMRGHIVIAFYRVPIKGFALLNEPVETVSEVFPHRRIGVFVDGESCRRMLDKQVQDAIFRQFTDGFQDFIGDEMKPARVFG